MSKVTSNNNIRNAGSRKENLIIEIPDENSDQLQTMQNIQIQNAELQNFLRYGKNSPNVRNYFQNQEKTITPMNGIQPKRKNSGQENGKPTTPKNSQTPKGRIIQSAKQGQKQVTKENQQQANKNFNFAQNVIANNIVLSARQATNTNPFLKKSEVPSFDSHKSPQTYIFKTNVHPTTMMKSATPSHRTAQEIQFSQKATSETKGQRISQTPTARTTQLNSNTFDIEDYQKTQKKQSNASEASTNLDQVYQDSYKMYGKREEVASEKQSHNQHAIMRPYSSTPKASVTKLSSQANKMAKQNKQSDSFDQSKMSKTQQVQQTFMNIAQKNQQQTNYQNQQTQLYQQYKQKQEDKNETEQKPKVQQENIQQQKVKSKQQSQKQQHPQNINQLVTKVQQQNQQQSQNNKKEQLTSQQIAQRSEEIYKEHLFQTFQAMKFVNQIPSADPEQLKNKTVFLQKPKGYENKRTIVFDLDETLVHCCDDINQNPDVILPVIFPTGEQAGINIRPYARECLTEANKNFEVIVFTASHKCYADVVLNHLDPDRTLIHHRLYRESCIITEGIYIKDLRILQTRNIKDIVIVDNAAYSFGYQIDNGIPIISWHDDKYDRELYNLIDYLKVLAESPDICEINRKTFHLRTFYEDYLREFLQSTQSPKNRRSSREN